MQKCRCCKKGVLCHTFYFRSRKSSPQMLRIFVPSSLRLGRKSKEADGNTHGNPLRARCQSTVRSGILNMSGQLRAKILRSILSRCRSFSARKLYRTDSKRTEQHVPSKQIQRNADGACTAPKKYGYAQAIRLSLERAMP